MMQDLLRLHSHLSWISAGHVNKVEVVTKEVNGNNKH